jgi:aminoglycoside 3-N-acetyltransferase I
MNNKELQVIKLDNGDVLILQKLILLFQEMFKIENPAHTKESYLEGLLENNCFIALVTIYENEIVGGLTAYELPMYYSEYSEIFIYDLAVKPEFRRRGFGKKLLSTLKEYCMTNGIRTFFAEAHEKDKYTVNFYHSTGGNSEKVVHFNYQVH